MEDLNSLYVLLKTTQDDNFKITCTWDFSKSGNIDEHVLTTKHFEKIIKRKAKRGQGPPPLPFAGHCGPAG